MKLIRAWSVSHHLRSALATATLIATPLVAHAQQATITGRVLAQANSTGSRPEPLLGHRFGAAGTYTTTNTVNACGLYIHFQS